MPDSAESSITWAADMCPDCVESYGHTVCKGACAADALRAASEPYERKTAPADDWLTIKENQK